MFQKKLLKKLVALVLVGMLSFSMVACGANQVVADGTTLPSVVSQENEIIITDHLGREVTLTKPAEHIVSGYYITTSLLIALGLQESTVGTESGRKARPIYGLAAPKFMELPEVGTAKEFNLEACVALKPDIVILPIKLKDTIATLEEMGITAIGVNPEDEALLNETITMVAKATGTEKQGEKLKDYYQEQNIKLLERNKNTKEKQKVYLGGNGDILKTATGKMYQNTMISKAGGENVGAEIADVYWATISYEQLIAYNPDVIVMIPFAGYDKESILNDEKLKGITAIKNGDVYEMPSTFEAWDSPVPSGILGSMWLSSILNEKAYPFEEFKQDAAAFYKEFYQIEIDKEDVTK